MDFLFIGWDNRCKAATEGGFPSVVGKEVRAEASAAMHDAFLASIGVKVRMLDDFPRVILLHHPRLGIEGVHGFLDALAPFVSGHVVTDVDAA